MLKYWKTLVSKLILASPRDTEARAFTLRLVGVSA